MKILTLFIICILFVLALSMAHVGIQPITIGWQSKLICVCIFSPWLTKMARTQWMVVLAKFYSNGLIRGTIVCVNSIKYNPLIDTLKSQGWNSQPRDHLRNESLQTTHHQITKEKEKKRKVKKLHIPKLVMKSLVDLYTKMQLSTFHS